MSLRLLMAKDLRREWRSRESLQAGLVLVALFLVLDIFVFPDLEGSPRAAAALVWTPLLFAAAAVTGRGWAAESDRGTLDWLRTAPASRRLIGLSRTLTDALLVVVLTLGVLAGASLLWGLPGLRLLPLALLLAAGLVLIGGMTGAVAAHAEAREILLPILLVPVAAPLLLAAVQGSLVVLAGAPAEELRVPMLLMAGYDLIAAGLAWLLWPVLMEAD